MELPDEVARLLTEAAQAQGTTVSELAVYALEREARHIMGRIALEKQLTEMEDIPEDVLARAEETDRRLEERVLGAAFREAS